jgi:acetoacetate decarboxylase
LGLKGRVNRSNVGFGIPSDAPLYGKPPYYYRDLERMVISYETDAEAVANVLPEGLEVPDTATAALIFVNYPFSTLGPYLETILTVGCLWEGQMTSLVAHIVVDTDPPQAAGREIWGFPKKIAHITMDMEADLVIGTMERPTGNRICTAVMRPEVPVETSTPARSGPGGMSLRVIPATDGSSDPALMELIETKGSTEVKAAYTGQGFAEYPSKSTLDPWHRFPVIKVLGARYEVADMVLPGGKVIKTY